MSTLDTSTRDFALPDLGEGLEDAVLVEWHVVVGQHVTLNQPLCTVETEKATVEIPSPYAGQVAERIGEPGATIEVGAVLVRMVVEPTDVGASAPGDADVGDDTSSQGARGTPTLVGYGPDLAPIRYRSRAPVPTVTSNRAPSAPAPGPALARAPALARKPRTKPPVRKLARELGVDLAAVGAGTGPDATITRADVEQAATAGAAEAPSTGSVSGVQAGDVIPMQGIRARIAARMTTSRSAIPDASCAVEVDCGRIVALRAAIREPVRAQAGVDVVTPFVLILRALVVALESHPILNATLDEDGASIRVHDEIHVGIGVDTPAGLLVPVVRGARDLPLVGLAVEVRRLVDGARRGTLTVPELTGSTFTVSNFGSFGLDEGYPVINHPEVAIIGLGAIRERPVVVDGDIVARPTATFSCCFDHRVCDGADVGRFLSTVRDLVESPEQLLLER